MGSIIISIFTFILLLVCGLMTVIILMQKPSANAGMGASLGGGAAESVFGGETANVLLKYTVRIAVVFFALSFVLYLANLWNHRGVTVQSGTTLPNIPVPAGAANTTTTAPAAASGSAAAAKASASTAAPAAPAPATSSAK